MKKSSKKLSLNKLTISRITIADQIMGGSGNVICKPRSEPLNNCPPPHSCLRTVCASCITNQANGC